MGAQDTTVMIARQEWLRPIEEAAQHAIHRIFRSAGPTGQKVKNALHGTRLGHPLRAREWAALCWKASSLIHSVKCPWHGSRFALEDGRVLDRPAVHPQPSLEARARNGQIEVRNAIGSRPVSGTASVPAIGEALVPASRFS